MTNSTSSTQFELQGRSVRVVTLCLRRAPRSNHTEQVMRYHQVVATDGELEAGAHFAAVREKLAEAGLEAIRHWDDSRLGSFELVEQLTGREQDFEPVEIARRSPIRAIRVGLFIHDAKHGCRYEEAAVDATEEEIQLGTHLEVAKSRQGDRVVLVIDERDPVFRMLEAAPREDEPRERMGERLTAHVAFVRERLAPADAVSVKYGSNVHLAINSSSLDDRVYVRCDGMGATTINYRQDGLTMEVISETGEEYDTWAIDAEHLTEEPEDSAQVFRIR